MINVTHSLSCSPEHREKMREAAKHYWVQPTSPRIHLGRLAGDEKRQVWEHLKREHPDVASTIQSDQVQAIRTLFGADIVLEVSQLPPELRHEFD